MADDRSLNDRLAEEFATGEADLTRATSLAAIPPPSEDINSLAKSVRALKSAVDSLRGFGSTVLDKALTARDMLNAGTMVYTPSSGLSAGAVTFSSVSGGGSGGSGTAGYVDPRPAPTTPPTPTGLTASGGFRSVILAWTDPGVANRAYTEVWRYTADNLSLAVANIGNRIGQPTANIFEDTAASPSVPYFYWIRHVDTAGATGAYSSSVTGGALLIGSTDFGALVVEAAALKNNAVNGDKLAVGAIAVGSAAIAAGAITNAMIADATIDNAKIGNLDAVKINAGTLDAARIAAGSLNADKIAAGTISATQIGVGAITADRIDSRGLSIKDASGNVILAAGTALGSSYVSPAAGWLNNYNENGVTHVMRPGGGSYNGGTASMVGYIKVRLPQSWTDSMLRFFIDVYEYASDASVTYEVGGYTYAAGSAWVNTYARAVGNPANVRAVRFGHDGTRCCVFVGAYFGTLQFPVVQLRDFVVGYNAQALGNWESGWQVTVANTTELFNAGTILIAKPLPGGAMSGIDKITAGTASTYIENAAIGTAQIANASIGQAQIDLATVNKLVVGNANIGDAAINTANIGDLQVSTLKIQSQAVTIPNSSYNATTVSCPANTNTTVQSISWTSTGAKVFVTFSTTIEWLSTTAANCQFTVVTQAGTTIWSGYFQSTRLGMNVATFAYVWDSPPVGSVSLTIKAYPSLAVDIYNRVLFAIETKK